MRSTRKIALIYLSTLFITFISLAGTTQAKSLYVIIDRSSTIRAYKIIGEKIEKQIDVKNLDDHGGAVGLALDPDSATMFVTYENSNIIEMVNAKTMQQIKSIPVSDELAGIVYDQERQKLYATSRDDDKLYVYLWDSINQTLTLEDETHKTLNQISQNGAFGIALDETDRILYVTDLTNSVKYYDANDPNFAYLGSIEITVDSDDRESVGIDFYRDQQGNKHLYAGAWMHDTYHNYLVRTDINDVSNPVSTQHDVGAGVIGIAVDQATGYVYVTTSNNPIEIYDNFTFPSDPCYIDLNDFDGFPADIIVRGDVSYKDPCFSVVKADVNEPNCVIPNDYITYEITYGPNGVDHNNIVITDFLSFDVNFVSAGDPNDPNFISDVNNAVITDYLPEDVVFSSASGGCHPEV